MRFELAVLFSVYVVAVSVDGGSETTCSCAKDDFVCQQECDSDEASDAAGKYKKRDSRWQKYTDKIDEALLNYKPCTHTDCRCYQQQIDNDLAPFRQSGISKEQFDSAFRLNTRRVHYQIIDHKVYRTKDCMFPARCKGIEHFLVDVAARLANVEFVLNDRDYPFVHRQRDARLPTPNFSFSKTADYLDIMYPAWSFWAGGPAVKTHPMGLGRWDLLRDSLNEAATSQPWTAKEPRGFFRGSRTSAERDPLVLLSRAKPHLVDAQYTKNQAWKSDKDTLGAPPADVVHFDDHCRFKYLFNFRGVAASFRLKHLFLCGSAVLHVGDDWLEFFYGALQPWVHYIPVSTSLSEVEDLLEFAVANDDVVRDIAKRGRDFIWQHLTLDDVSCYWERLLTEYASLMSYEFERDPELVQVQ